MQNNQNTKYRKHDKRYWEKHITLWQESNLSQSEYCRQNNIPLKSFCNWKGKLLSDIIPATPFIELRGHYPAQVEYFELQIDSILTLRIRESIQPDLLRNILIAVRGV
ncbi:MAG: hypothetical protein JXN62_02170 [Bacteroidales bacterium]|nr:hypothetical protein [Bacteroidales bacterium]